MVKLTHSKGKINAGLTFGAILGAAIPIIVTAATGGLAAVPVAMWLALGGVMSGLLAGNVEMMSPAERLMAAEIRKAGKSDGL